MNRRQCLKLSLAGLISSISTIGHTSPASWILEALQSEINHNDICGAQEAALKSTLKRLEKVNFITKGKLLVVNIPSGVVTAYTDGEPVIESRAVVGMDITPTPEMTSKVTLVRPNPTWTVPQSIINRKKWKNKLAEEPEFFAENNFQIIVNGKSMSPYEAASVAQNASLFVQQPSPINALGLLKIGLHNANGIYLHDTNEPSRYNADVRAGSAGCVRIEHVRDIAGWIMNKDRHEIDNMIASGDTTDYGPFNDIAVILGYWTAWPDSNGNIQYYPDIYNWDNGGMSCDGVIQRDAADGYPQSSSRNGRLIWRDYK